MEAPAPHSPAETELTVTSAERMRALGRRLAALLRPGDLVMLDGELGAGKTTLTRGLGEGLGVRGAVTSPTFVIARVHPPLGDGPALVHVDAYRLHGGLDEMEDLDLDVSLPESVVVVEWGEGKVEELTEDRLQIRIDRAVGDASGPSPAPGAAQGSASPEGPGDGSAVSDDLADPGADDVRRVRLTAHGARWSQADLRALAEAFAAETAVPASEAAETAVPASETAETAAPASETAAHAPEAV